MRAVAAGTGGRVLSSPSPRDADQVLGEIISEASSAPFAWAGGPYLAKPGEVIALDGRGSFDDGTLVSFEWDFNGDGRYELTTREPQIMRSFPAEFRGVVGLRVTDDRGLKAEGTAPIVVAVDGDPVLAAYDNCADVENPGQEDFDGDGTGDACDTTSGFPDPPRPPRESGIPTPLLIGLSVGLGVGLLAVVVVLASRRSRPAPFCDACGARQDGRVLYCDRCGSRLSAVR